MESIASDWRSALLTPADRALCSHAAKLTHHQHAVSPADLDLLRGHGFDDVAIHDATQVIAYFNYITRIANGLGVEPESFVRAWGSGQ
ncbi:MAG: hypothetical protein KJZ86_10130 [Caldilineaceae bacterium]|nr:hypothetical protein [Caldilineaceae bacterium]HRJ42941.1 hypothetical protein [Caldilineaceae bacterium]